MNYIAGSVRRQYESNPGPILPFGIALSDLEQENKFLIFGQCWRWIRQKRQKTVKFDLLQTQLGFFPSSWDKWVIFFCPSALFLPYSKTFIDQACSVKRAEYKSLRRFFMNFHFVSIHNNTHAKKENSANAAIFFITLGQERIFICIYQWQVKFFLHFLASGSIYQTTRILF